MAAMLIVFFLLRFIDWFDKTILNVTNHGKQKMANLSLILLHYPVVFARTALDCFLTLLLYTLVRRNLDKRIFLVYQYFRGDNKTKR